jgi:hypothetical protein
MLCSPYKVLYTDSNSENDTNEDRVRVKRQRTASVPCHVTGERLERSVSLNNESTTTIVLKITRQFHGMLCNLDKCLHIDSNNEKGTNEDSVKVKIKSENDDGDKDQGR